MSVYRHRTNRLVLRVRPAPAAEPTASTEVDLHLSKDNHWILFHDDVLEMRTNFSGCVRDFLKSDFEDAFYLGFHKYKVQALSDIDFSQFEMVFLDIRHYDACSNFALLDTAHMHHDILETVNRFPNQRFIILSRSAHVLNHFRSLNFDICHEVIDFKSVEISANSFGFNFHLQININKL